MSRDFETEYKKLNPAQKDAVDTLSGPVMVVAGPGTGKTQVLSMRIANILHKTDIKADGILCLTFTNSAAEAMKERLERYIGEAGAEVNVSTFHSFGMKLVEEYYKILGLEAAPKLLDDIEALTLLDEVLRKNSWQYLSPRGDRARYFGDLRSLISLLKRERITPKNFLSEVEKEIKRIKNDPENISTRGESKGELKKDILSKIESLGRSRETAVFFELYEETKKIKNVLDYDDVLESMVEIVEKSKDAAADIRERYLYVLVDEHQDSSRVQNEFLKAVWGKVESPDLFVVGDDRQLIYGFSGTSIDHFKGFKKTWKDAKLITLVDNYRSTQLILDLSHALLESVMTKEKLKSQSKENHPIRLVQTESEADEISACAEDIKEKIKTGVNPSDCAILVPKNSQVREALRLLHDEGLQVSTFDALDLFDQKLAAEFIRILKTISRPEDNASFARSFLDDVSGIPKFEAHNYLAAQKMRDFSLESAAAANPSLFGGGKVKDWINKLKTWSENIDDPALVIETIGKDLLKEEHSLVSAGEILNTILNLVAKEKEKNPSLTLPEFVSFLERLESYGEHVPLVMDKKEGVKVLTLHSSKGLEFEYVWIAHMDERGLNGGKRKPFTLPETIEEKVLEKDADQAKRKLYVAITRAKRFCTLSYSTGEQGSKQVARVIEELPAEILQKEVWKGKNAKKAATDSHLAEIIKLAAQKYKDRVVSASSLNNFFECSWKWYFRNLLGLPEAANENLTFGDKVHKAIDQILKSKKVVLPDDPEVAALVKAWADGRLKEIASDRFNEQPVSFSDPRFPDLNIFGRVDLIERLPDGSLRVTDFKTGSAKRKSDIVKRDEEGRLSNLARQLAMYSYLLQGTPKWQGAKVLGSRLEFLEAKNPKERIYDHPTNQDEIDLLVKDIADYDEAIKSGSWVSRVCRYNSYGKNTECEYCQMAESYN